MDIKDKILDALGRSFTIEYARLEEDDGLSGFVVSEEFKGMSALDRQRRIDDALSGPPLTPEERHHILMIAAITPAEYEAAGASIRVMGVTERKGEVEILVHGGSSDAEYVRHAFDRQKGVRTTEPKRSVGAGGVLMSFRAKGTAAAPLTKEKALRVLRKTRYVVVTPNACAPGMNKA